MRFAAATFVTIAASSAFAMPMEVEPQPEPPSTKPPEPYSVFALNLQLGVTFATNGDLNPDPAPSLGVDVGVRTDPATTLGLHLSFARLRGNAAEDVGGYQYTTLPIDLTAFATERFLDVAWGGAFLGGHFDRYSDPYNPTTWTSGVTFGLIVGLDLVKIGEQHLGVFALAESEVSDSGYVGATIGVAVRR